MRSSFNPSLSQIMAEITPGMWCDADVIAMKAHIAELEAFIFGFSATRSALDTNLKDECDRQAVRIAELEAEVARLKAGHD